MTHGSDRTLPSTVLAAALPDGGTVGVVAPASPYHNRSQLERGLRMWEERGFRVKTAPGIHARDRYHAGPAASRAADLSAMFADPEVDVVQCLQGGYGSHQTVPHLDLEVVRAHPKPFIGYSDITSLHVAIRQATGLVTFYGPGLMSSSAPEASAFTRDHMTATLQGRAGAVIPRSPDDPYLRTMRGGRVTGQLVGGDLWELRETLATPWEIETEGRLLFFEDVDVPPWQIDGLLGQLTHAGKLSGVRGVVVGEMAGCQWERGKSVWPATKSLEDVLEYYLEPLDVPVLYGLPLGHGAHQATLPLGVRVTLDADAQTLTLEEPALTVG